MAVLLPNLDRYFLISLPIALISYSSIQLVSSACHSNPLPVRHFDVAYCHRKLKVRLTEEENMV